MTPQKKKTAKKVDIDVRTAKLFESAQPKSTSRRPEMSPMLSSIIETTFRLPDPEAVYAELEAALDRRQEALTPGVIRAELSDNARLYRLAHQLYVVARYDFEKYQHEYTAINGSMRDEAARELQIQKASGVRSKAITNDDVESHMTLMYPDAVLDMREREVAARKTIEHLNHLVEVFKSRGFALRALCGTREEL